MMHTMFNITISAIAVFFVFACWVNPQETGVLGAIGWIFVSGYFFMCSLNELYIIDMQKDKNDQDHKNFPDYCPECAKKIKECGK